MGFASIFDSNEELEDDDDVAVFWDTAMLAIPYASIAHTCPTLFIFFCICSPSMTTQVDNVINIRSKTPA